MISYIFPIEENDVFVVTEGKIRVLLFKTKGFCWFTNFSKVEIKLFLGGKYRFCYENSLYFHVGSLRSFFVLSSLI